MSTRAWRLLLTITFLLLIFGAPVQLPQFSHIIEKDAGAWGLIIWALANIPCSVLAIPASILTEEFIYLAWGLASLRTLGSTLGTTAAFLVGRTVGRSYVTSKLKDYPQFQAIAVAVRKSGFKIVLLLRLVPLLPFNTNCAGCKCIVDRCYLDLNFHSFYAVVVGRPPRISQILATVVLIIMLAVGVIATIVLSTLVTRIFRDALRHRRK